ncbi:MAG TPA: response regulator [Vicinamibacterales bacterium]
MPTILVVDDSPTIRRMVRTALGSLSDVTFAEAGSGLQAIETLAVQPVRAVVLDLNMPDTHGLDVLRFLRSHEQYRQLPVMILTTRGDDTTREPHSWARILLGRSDIDRPLLDRGLHVIERNAQAQAKLIDDMLDMGRIIAGKLRVEMRPVDLVGVVLAAIDVVMPSANAKGIAVRSYLNPRAPHVRGDQDRLQQVVWNLLSNAVTFTETGGTIEVRLEVSGARARIVVRDTGRGIAADFLPHVFERFRQNDSSSARRYGGLGLGLALVRDLVELHGGAVNAASEGLNRGATFTIELPTVVQPAAPPTSEAVGENEESAVLAGVRVLVVEDESDAREVTVIVLEHSGATVTAVGSSADGVSAILASSPHALPHVLVSDIGMPGENGYDFIRRVRALDPAQGGTIPAVTVSGYATPEDVDRALAAGYQRHIAKPMDPSTLVATVIDVIKKAQAVGEKT